MNTLRILVLTSELPYPPTDANRAVVYNLLRHFRNKHDVTMVAMTSGDKAPKPLIVDILKAITNQDIGDDPRKWKEWYHQDRR